MGETVWKYNFLRLLYKISSVLMLVLFSFPVRAEVLNVCYDQWPPMTIFPTAEEPRRGVVIDILSDIYKAAGYDLRFLEVPYARGMQMVESGQCDLLPEKEYSPNDAKGFVYAHQETFKYPTAFVVRHGDPWRYQGVESVRGKRVGTGPGWNYSSMSEGYQNYMDDPANKEMVEVVAGNADVVERILNMIIAGRLDLYADNIFVLQYVVNLAGLSEKLDIVTPGLGKLLVEKPIFSLKLASQKRQQLIEIWDKGRQALSEAEEVTYIKQYGLNVWDMN